LENCFSLFSLSLSPSGHQQIVLTNGQKKVSRFYPIHFKEKKRQNNHNPINCFLKIPEKKKRKIIGPMRFSSFY
jgi:hypothetical protein